MTDLRLSEPNGYNIFCRWIVHHLLSYSKLLPLESTKDLLTCEKQSVCQILFITLCYLDGGNTFEALNIIRARSPQSIGIPVLETSVQLEKRLG
jgi:hypothetical protein